VPVEREQGLEVRRDEQRVVDEIRRLFERYRMAANDATGAAAPDQQHDSLDESPALTSR
jgi:hypothetical protein